MRKLTVLIFLLFISYATFGQQSNIVVNWWNGELTGITSAKVDRDTISVNFSEFVNFTNADSIFLIGGIDTIAGQVGPNVIDSMGISAVQLRYIPILREPWDGFKKGINVNDTIITAPGGAVLEDSILSRGNARLYSAELKYLQYMFIIEYNYGDTANIVNNKVRTEYNFGIFIK